MHSTTTIGQLLRFLIYSSMYKHPRIPYLILQNPEKIPRIHRPLILYLLQIPPLLQCSIQQSELIIKLIIINRTN